jgi:LPS O-antigen subunit length determinant protein (WzzB/FepE family)
MNEEIEQKIRAEIWKSEVNKPSDVNLIEIFSEIWKNKILVIVLGFGFGVLGIFYAMAQPNIYKSEAIVAPAPSNSGQGIGNLGGQLGGLASLAGLNFGSNTGVDKTQLALEILKSQKFLGEFVNKHNLKPILFAVTDWDLIKNELVFDQEIYDQSTEEWNREVEAPKKPEPSDQEVYELLEDILKIEAADTAGFYKISFLHYSPYVAKDITDKLVSEINEHMRQLEQQEAVRSIEFLQSKLDEVSAAEVLTVMYELIEEQTKTLMFTQVRQEYAFQTVDPAVVSEKRDSPARTLIVLFSGFLGGVIAIMIVLVRMVLRSLKQNTQRTEV